MHATPIAKPVATVTPCVCCRARPHQGRPDPDLAGYVCHPCAVQLRKVAALLAEAGFEACVPHPHEP